MMKHTLQPGKVRALRATATAKGIFTILAADHRDSLKVMVNPENLRAVSASYVTQLKLEICRELIGFASGVLLDPVYGAPQAIMSGDLPGGHGWISSLEDQGYLGDPYRPQTPLLTGWNVEKAKRLGATGVKILLKYHPDAGDVAKKQEALVEAVLADGARYELPLFLEPIVYPLDPKLSAKSAEFAAQRRDLVVRTARRFSELGADVLKMEFPIDAHHSNDVAEWRDACAELSEAITVPWALLSAGVPHEVFREQLRTACEAGCSGFLAGRAVWREAVTLKGASRLRFLRSRAAQRFKELVAIAEAEATPWTAFYNLPPIDEHWYKTY